MPGLAPVVQFLAQPRGDLDRDLGGVDGGIEPLAQRQQQMKLAQIGFDRSVTSELITFTIRMPR